MLTVASSKHPVTFVPILAPNPGDATGNRRVNEEFDYYRAQSLSVVCKLFSNVVVQSAYFWILQLTPGPQNDSIA